jgi:hypothetical protein
MIHFLRKLVSIFIDMGDDDNVRKGYHTTVIKKCDNCSRVPDYIYRFNASWLCEGCFTGERIRFPTVIPNDEELN